MSRLDHMFEIQRGLQYKLGTFEKIKNDADRQEYINQMLLAIFEETVEIMRKTPYKNPHYVKFGWKKTQQWDIDAYKEEIVDIWHFIMNLCIIVNMTPQEFYDIYRDKNKENHDRQDRNY